MIDSESRELFKKRNLSTSDSESFKVEGHEQVHRGIRGCCIYLVFLVSFVGMVMAGASPSADRFWTSSALKGEIVHFNRIIGDEIMDWGM